MQRDMRRGNSPKRSRGHSRANGRKPSNPNRSIESNAPDGGKVRGNASQLYDRYTGLARDAQSAGDRIGAEGFLQYAEHYYRVLNAAGQARGAQGESGNGGAEAGKNEQGGSGNPVEAAEDARDDESTEPEAAVN